MAMSGLPVDYIGFVFAPSRRQVKANDVARWIAARTGEGVSNAANAANADIEETPRYAGVYVNPSLSELGETMDTVPLNVVQLHGQESADFCRAVKNKWPVSVWKVFSVPEADDMNALLSAEAVDQLLHPYADTVDAIMLDTTGGGSGRTFRWETIPMFRDWAEQRKLPLIVAGGLNEGNVAELLTQYNPDAVDVSSGVETDGRKDIMKIRTFVERVKSQDG